MPRVPTDRSHSRESLRPTSVLVRLSVRFQDGKFSDFISAVDHMEAAMNSGATAPQIRLTEESPSGKTMSGEIEIAIPNDVLRNNVGVSMLMAIAGYYSSYSGVEGYGIERIELCEASMDALQLLGPINTLTPAGAGPISIGAILKPRFAPGQPPEIKRYLAWCGKAGFDLVVEDELTNVGDVSQVLNRVRWASDVLVGAESDARYVVNLTRRMSEALEIAEELQNVPQSGAMLNIVTMGIDAVEEVRSRFMVPVVANVVGRGMIGGGPNFYVREEVLCKLARLSGADAVYTGPFVGAIETDKDRVRRLRAALNDDIVEGASYHPSAAVMSGGLNIVNSFRNISYYRERMMLLWGSEAYKLYTENVPPLVVKDALDVLREDEFEDEVEMKSELKVRVKRRLRSSTDSVLELMGID